MTALFAAVFVASLLGSMHCAGMCGAFLAFAVASGEGESAPSRLRSRAALNAAYNGGRLATYTMLGAISGGIGAAVDLGASAVGVQRAAAMLAGALMVGFGIVAILRLRGVRVPRMPLPGVLRDAVMRGHRATAGLPPIGRALAVGLLTTLLPCGWLYAFVITAAGTASPAMGALAMAAFWLGTLPMMIALGAGIQSLAGPLRARLPMLTSVLLVAVGLYTLAGRMALPAMASGGERPGAVDAAQAIDRVRSLNVEEMPCCHGD